MSRRWLCGWPMRRRRARRRWASGRFGLRWRCARVVAMAMRLLRGGEGASWRCLPRGMRPRRALTHGLSVGGQLGRFKGCLFFLSRFLCFFSVFLSSSCFWSMMYYVLLAYDSPLHWRDKEGQGILGGGFASFFWQAIGIGIRCTSASSILHLLWYVYWRPYTRLPGLWLQQNSLLPKRENIITIKHKKCYFGVNKRT